MQAEAVYSWLGCGIAGVILHCRAILRFALQTQTSERYASRLHVDYWIMIAFEIGL